jgi:hypothetical protein
MQGTCKMQSLVRTLTLGPLASFTMNRPIVERNVSSKVGKETKSFNY